MPSYFLTSSLAFAFGLFAYAHVEMTDPSSVKPAKLFAAF